AERGIEGSCEVRFDVNARGEPFNVEAVCTDSVFRREAERAVSRVRFAPKIVRGQALERRNVVYPIEFGLDG
ncbi:MAG: energy transducer TonB, partial [Hyphomonadaceae bacterium]|nr:energy transducer TonB [Hyphomonadaceae bacterium]